MNLALVRKEEEAADEDWMDRVVDSKRSRIMLRIVYGCMLYIYDQYVHVYINMYMHIYGMDYEKV